MNGLDQFIQAGGELGVVDPQLPGQPAPEANIGQGVFDNDQTDPSPGPLRIPIDERRVTAPSASARLVPRGAMTIRFRSFIGPIDPV